MIFSEKKNASIVTKKKIPSIHFIKFNNNQTTQTYIQFGH